MMQGRDHGRGPRLVALATAHPSYDLAQDEVARQGADLFATTHGGFERLAPIYHNAEIENRHACTPIEWFLEPHSFSDRNDLFLENAVGLLKDAAEKALGSAGLEASDIDAVVTVSSTGI